MSMTTASLQGRHAVVTGGGRGIGAAIAAALAGQGARITLMGRTRATLGQEAGRLRALADIQYGTVDVGGALAHAAQTFGPIAILLNNAMPARLSARRSARPARRCGSRCLP